MTNEKQINSFIYINNEEIDGIAFFDFESFKDEMDYEFKYFISNSGLKFDESEIEVACMERLTEKFLESFN